MQASAIAHPNVALIKYWGKQDSQANLPATGSLSLTLSQLHTRTTVSFLPEAAADTLILDGQQVVGPMSRLSAVLDQLRHRAGVAYGARVESSNDFPTGAGLASSASGYAALTVAAAAALKLKLPTDELANVARLGSGSAPRSLFSGIVLLENDVAGDRVSCRSVAAPSDWPLQVQVAVTSRMSKAVGSTGGMELSRRTSPFYPAWLATHAADLGAALKCVAQRDFETLADLAEHSCLKMHAVAMSSRPALLYWNAATVACMQIICELRRTGLPVFFTIDAGPQVKAVCEPGAASQVQAALLACPGVLEVRSCGLGGGAWVA